MGLDMGKVGEGVLGGESYVGVDLVLCPSYFGDVGPGFSRSPTRLCSGAGGVVQGGIGAVVSWGIAGVHKGIGD